MDQPAKRLASDILGLFAILTITVLAFIEYSQSGILLAGGLAITVWVAADIILFRKG